MADDDSNEQRRRRILASRQDRLARIMTLGTGRTVDASEVRLEPLREAERAAPVPAAPPVSPTASERAAAGIGSALASHSGSDGESDDGDAVSETDSEGRSLLDPLPSQRACPKRTARHHALVVVLAAAMVVLWLRFVAGDLGRAGMRSGRVGRGGMRTSASVSEPWHVMLGSFVAVELAELLLGRVSLLAVPKDACLYVLLLVLAVRTGLVHL